MNSLIKKGRFEMLLLKTAIYETEKKARKITTEKEVWAINMVDSQIRSQIEKLYQTLEREEYCWICNLSGPCF